MYGNLKKHLDKRMPLLSGDWVSKRSSYESAAVKALGFVLDESTHHDATWGKYRIELKKGKSIWIDIARYAELVHSGVASDPDSVTLFLIPNVEGVRIETIVAVQTAKLIELFRLTKSDAALLRRIKKQVPRSLNVQASLTIPDLLAIQEFYCGTQRAERGRAR